LFRFLFIAFSAVLFAPASASAKDAPMPARIVAVGDLHGDYGAWLDVARDAKLVDGANHWAGGATMLVQLGDIVDRGPDSLKIIRHLQQLQREAPRAGGKVVVILGNHEAMNLLGDLRYTTAGEFAAFSTPRSTAAREAYLNQNFKDIAAAARVRDKTLTDEMIRQAWLEKTPLGWVEHKLAWSPKGPIGSWAAKNPAILKVGDYLFVHGGISVETTEAPLAIVNMAFAKAMANADDRDDSPLNNPLGPLWYRGLLQVDRDAQAVRQARPQTTPLTPEQELAQVLSNYGANHMVVGHTPAKKPISILYGGRLARIDTAMSSFYGGPLSWLEISGGKMTPHVVARSGP
jgi:hypothetical protein